jgi:RimJ/RimL family protein N-acetyltransferase
MLNIHKVILSGNHVILRPPRTEDLEDLKNVARDGEIWKSPYSLFPNIQEMSIYLQELLNHDETILPFVIIFKSSKQIVGTTRFLNIDSHNHRLEIGHTWIAKSFRRTVVNTEAKFLMLQHAFEELKCIAVEIRTDVLNEVSRKAIERLGAKQDGILRNHRIMRDGRIRDTVCYSITKEEWPDVKSVLLQEMKN